MLSWGVIRVCLRSSHVEGEIRAVEWLMEDKRLDLDAPLMSVRRQSVPLAAVNPLQRSSLPFYKSDLKSGPVRNPGVVPFVWEKKPGQPKGKDPLRHRLPQGPALPPRGIPNDGETAKIIREYKSRQNAVPSRLAAAIVSEELPPMEDDDNFSEAVSGLSVLNNSIEPSGSFSNLKVGDFMMDRFLPAAQAMATGSTHSAPKKAAKVENTIDNGDRRLARVPLPYQHRPNFAACYPRDVLDEGASLDGDSDGDSDYDGNTFYSSKACGLLPQLRLKNSICLLNAMPGKKLGRRSHRPPPTSWKLGGIPQNNRLLDQAEDELWEEVHKHKLSFGLHPSGEGGSKTTSESNQYGKLSDSPTPDESSCRHSGGSREIQAEILDRDRKNCKSDGSDCFDKDGERFWVRSSTHGSLEGSGFLSPTGLRPLRWNSGDLPGDLHSMAIPDENIMDAKNFGSSGVLLGIPEFDPSSAERKMDVNMFKEENRTVGADSKCRVLVQENGDSVELEMPNFVAFQPPSSGIIESDLLLYSNTNRGVEGQLNAFHVIGRSDDSLLLKGEDLSKKVSDPFLSLLPPPLPKSPSESWLSHTLPSVSSRIQPGQSILGSKALQRKQAFPTSSVKQKEILKHLESQELQRCSLPLTEPSDEIKKHFMPLHEEVCDTKSSKTHCRQIRFADVLTMPLSP